MTTIIPPKLPEDVKIWTTQHVVRFMEANKDQYQLIDEDLQVLEKERIGGRDLLQLELKNLRDAGMTLGPAVRIMELINVLKGAKGLVETGLLSLRDFFKVSPPALGYGFKTKRTGSTFSTSGCPPESVVAWDGFKDEVNSAIQHLEDDTPKHPPPKFLEYPSIGSNDLQGAFYANILLPFRKVLGEDGIFCSYSISPKGVVGEPDFIQIDSNGTLHLVIEVKTKWALSVDDLVEAYHQGCTEFESTRKPKPKAAPPPILRKIQQVFGYLSTNRLRFGALSTYDRTWFLYRPPKESGRLCVSPTILYDSQDPTLFQCVYYLYLQALEDYECSTAPPLPKVPLACDDSDSDYDVSKTGGSKRKPRKPRDEGKSKRSRVCGGPGVTTRSRAAGKHMRRTRTGHPSNGEEGHTPLDFFDWDSFRVLDILGDGRSGTVFKAILREEIVALKVCDLWKHPNYKEELLNEVKVYHALRDLQGYCVPKLKGAGYTAGGLFAIATDIVGRPLEDAEQLTEEECRTIQEALSCMHNRGFVHCDIRKSNILIQRSSQQFHAFLIDFTFSKPSRRLEFQSEKELLARLLREL